MAHPPSKTDMARAIVQRLQRLPYLPAADSPLVAEVSAYSDAMVRILHDGADPAGPHALPASLDGTRLQHATAGENAAAYEMVLRLSEAEGDLLRDAVELMSTRSYALEYGTTLDSLLAKLRLEELIMAGCRLADVRNDAAYKAAGR